MTRIMEDFDIDVRNGRLSKKFFDSKNVIDMRDIVENYVSTWKEAHLKSSEYDSNDIFEDTSRLYDMLFENDKLKPEYENYILLNSQIRTCLHESLIESIIDGSLDKENLLDKNKLNRWVSDWCYDHMDESTYNEESIDADTESLYEFVVDQTTYSLKSKIEAFYN